MRGKVIGFDGAAICDLGKYKSCETREVPIVVQDERRLNASLGKMVMGLVN